MNEHTVQNAILRRYGSRQDMRLWRANTGAATLHGHHVRFGIPGQADLTGMLPGGRRLEIEVKSATGRQTVDQVNFQKMIEKFGGLYILARSVEDVDAAIGSNP